MVSKLLSSEAARPEGSVRGEQANFTRLVLSCIEANFCNQVLSAHWKMLAEIYTMHSFAPFSNLNFFVKNC